MVIKQPERDYGNIYFMNPKSFRRQFVDQHIEYGVYAWKMPDGKLVADDSGHFLLIESRRNDPVKLQALRDFARYDLGLDEGAPHWMPGHRIVSDEEYEEQKARLEAGLTPDPWDRENIKEDMAALRRNGRI